MGKWITVAVALLLLGGCATGQNPRIESMSPFGHCMFSGSEACRVHVTVVNNEVQVSNPEVLVYAGTRDVAMEWVLDTPGYSFKPCRRDFADPIVFKPDQRPAPQSTFEFVRPPGATGQYPNCNDKVTLFQLLNKKNENARTIYKYSVKVYDASGNVLFKDPTIVNDL